jgi:hypothetical protein
MECTMSIAITKHTTRTRPAKGSARKPRSKPVQAEAFAQTQTDYVAARDAHFHEIAEAGRAKEPMRDKKEAAAALAIIPQLEHEIGNLWTISSLFDTLRFAVKGGEFEPDESVYDLISDKIKEAASRLQDISEKPSKARYAGEPETPGMAALRETICADLGSAPDDTESLTH